MNSLTYQKKRREKTLSSSLLLYFVAMRIEMEKENFSLLLSQRQRTFHYSCAKIFYN